MTRVTRRAFFAAPLLAQENPAPPADPLARLLAGNARFRSAMALHPDQSPGRRFSLTMGQHPFACVLTCADSRVPPEVVFDQGLGDLFVIRVAGNIADDAVLGSIEYAASHLNVPLVLVLGHEKCGAVEAALRGERPGHVKSLVRAIGPAVQAARRLPGDPLDNAVRQNARLVAGRIRESGPVLRNLVAARRLRVVAARYSLDTSEIVLLD